MLALRSLAMVPTPRLPDAIAPAARPWLGLALSIALAGVASILLRQDSSWDLQNYHLYNAWAFVHGRDGLDWAPAQLQSYYSPYLDLPFYALVAAGVPSRLIAFALAVPTGIAWYCFARIVAVLFADLPDAQRRPAVAAAVAIGVTSPMAVSLIGTTMNDWYVAAFVLAALWVVVRGGDPLAARTRTLALAGLLVGAGAGLKLTGSVYGFGLLAALLAARGSARARIRASAVAGGAMAVAFAATAGPWMLVLWERYGNPLFPYFNDVFRSPWADPVSFAATRFGPASVGEWLAFPFLLLVRLEGYVSEPEFRDARPALLYALTLAAIVVAIAQRARPPVAATPASAGSAAAWRFVVAFFVASFAAWAVVYRIWRYLVPLELLAGALIAGLVVRLAPGRRTVLALAAALALVVVTAKFPTWWRQKFDEQFLTVTVPPVKPGALVLLVSAEPMSYVLPSFPPDARFAGLVSNFNDPDRKNRLQQTIAAAIRDHRGPLYALAVPPGRDEGGGALAKVGLVRQSCAEIRTNLRVSPLELCELDRP
ncbi:MAG: glycosyltransferase 87 family protein [Burkholderiales bacterium]